MPTRTVLVVGGNGFLGGHVVAALRKRGWHVLRGVRQAEGRLREDERACDLTCMQSPAQWARALHGVDAVVNVAGILRESGAQTFDAIHLHGPLALAQACVERDIRSFVQISALGDPADGPFIASKHRFDALLAELQLQACVLRPSLVFATSGSYGGTSLLRALAGFPGFQWMPGHGGWPVQPVAAEDLGEIVAASIAREARGIFEVGGPEVMSLRDYQRRWRRWLRIPGEKVLVVPAALVSLQVAVWERLGRGPVGRTMWRMLRRGNVTDSDASIPLREQLGVAPRSLDEVLAVHPSQAQDRWQAQLYFLAPTLRACLVALWLLSAWAGLRASPAEIATVVGDAPLLSRAPLGLARCGAIVDLLLAVWLASGWRSRMALVVMALSVVAYTLGLGVLQPSLWLDPLGGLAKNLVVLPALAVLWVLVERR